MSTAPWAKIWWNWYVSRSHLGLSGVALALGPALMLICRASKKRHSDASCDGACDGTGDADVTCVEVRDAAGKPVTAKSLANIVRFAVAEVEAALAELVESGTLTVSTDGTYSFPNFWRYQETSQAARTRKLRASQKRHSDGIGDASCDGACDGVGDDKRLEVRGNKREVVEGDHGDAGASQPASAVATKKPSKRDADLVLLKRCAKAMAEEFGHETTPTASAKHWALGLAKARELAPKRSGLQEAAEEVLRAAYERLDAGRSTSFGYALQDCQVFAQAPLRAVPIPPKEAANDW